MTTQTAEQLTGKKCAPCEGGVDRYTPEQARQQLEALDGWELNDDATWISKSWQVKDFAEAIDFIQQVASEAEQEGHHPDVHLTGYRNVRIDLSTHAIDGLSENDFILAAKIDELPVELKQ
jgi:4a-hydroxytetrahydrobiopterin dehydratase